MGLKIDGNSFEYLYKNYDGPLYVTAAKNFYFQTPKYFAAHLPLYPILIRSGREIMNTLNLNADKLGYLKSMLSVNVLSTAALTCLFYFVLKKFKLTTNPWALAAVLLFLPRFLVVRSVGAPESLFMVLVLASLYFFEKEKYLWAGLMGGLAVMTKSPGILLFGAYTLAIAEKHYRERKIDYKWSWILLIPSGLLAVFLIYWKQMGDFLAYFHSGDNIHLVFPFSVFNFQKTWIGTAWLEEIFFYLFIYGLTIVNLWKSKYRSFFYFALVFFIATLFIQHRDIARYSLPLWPLALIANEKFFTSKKFLMVSLVLIFGIYLYAWNFITYNIMPIADWSAFM
ncbi:MAG: glycosyltransferase 87 family protein [Patescibacteria group bacterium]